jgi:hypothetical protein
MATDLADMFLQHLKISGVGLSANDLVLAGYPHLLSHILNGKEYGPLLKGPNVDRHKEEWGMLIKELISCAPKDRAIVDRFHTNWHVSHHYIRELVDDDELLMDMLWTWLPRYEGPDQLLYRGENIDRLECERIGTAWSDKVETAQMFAQGWNAMGKGGVIMETMAPADAIIAGPSAHSIWLGEHEFTVDWRRLSTISRKHYFRPCL